MLYIVNEQTFSGYNAISLDLVYVIAILLGTLVIISKNPIISVLFLIGCFFNYFVNNVLPYMVMTSNLLYHFSIKKKLTNVTSVSWDGYLAETSHITSIGNILYGNYSIWLIITSIILLLAMVGAIVITLKPQTNIK